MKTLIAAVLLLASQAVHAAELPNTLVELCIQTRESAIVVLNAKNRDVSKSELYEIILNGELAADDKDMFYHIIDMTYAGKSPDYLFDSCIRTARKVVKEVDAQKKTSRVDL